MAAQDNRTYVELANAGRPQAAVDRWRGTVAVVVLAAGCHVMAVAQETKRVGAKSPLVTVIGCAVPTAQPQLWTLTHASDPEVSTTVGFTNAERSSIAKRPLGHRAYQLIGVADFVDAETAARIGVRDRILTPARMNTTGMLAHGHRVAIKGLHIEGNPARLNLTSVVDLGWPCP